MDYTFSPKDFNSPTKEEIKNEKVNTCVNTEEVHRFIFKGSLFDIISINETIKTEPRYKNIRTTIFSCKREYYLVLESCDEKSIAFASINLLEENNIKLIHDIKPYLMEHGKELEVEKLWD